MLDEFQREEALIHFQRGLVLERANRFEEAVEEYRQAISHYPHLREAHDALGFYYQRHGLLAKAAEEFRIVANLENDFLSHFNLGYVLLELGRHDESLASFQRCLVIEPNDPATHYEVGYIHFLRGDYRAAIEQLQSPLHHYPEDWEIHNLIGSCRLRLGAYDEALAAFGDALRLAPRPLAQAQVIERISTVERYREIGAARDHAGHIREQLAMAQPVQTEAQRDRSARNALERQVEQLGLAPDRQHQQRQIARLDIVGEALRHLEQVGKRIGERARQAIERDHTGEAPAAGIAQRQEALERGADIGVSEMVI